MRHRSMRSALAACAAVTLAAACEGGPPTQSSAPLEHDHAVGFQTGSPEVSRKIAELRNWSAPFHDLDAAAEAGYSANIGCIDETITGVHPSVARGMGYHVTRGDVDLIGDGVIDIDQPEFLVYAPHERDAELPREERLRNARLVGFDYYVPAAVWPHPDPPEFFGEPFNWSPTFNGWIRHFYLWGHNPEGFEVDFNAAVGLCTELLTP